MRLPRTDTELALWLTNFSTSFAVHAAALGFTEADVSAVNADAAMLNYAVGELLPTYKSAFQARTSFKNLLRPRHCDDRRPAAAARDRPRARLRPARHSAAPA